MWKRLERLIINTCSGVIGKWWRRTFFCYYRETVRGQLKCDGTRSDTRFRLSAKRTSPFKSAGASVQLTTGSRGVRISRSNAGYTMFRGSVKNTGYPLHSPVPPSLPNPCVIVCHHISTGLYLVYCRVRSWVGNYLVVVLSPVCVGSSFFCELFGCLLCWFWISSKTQIHCLSFLSIVLATRYKFCVSVGSCDLPSVYRPHFVPLS